MTYQEIVNRIGNVAADHRMIADFGYGNLSDIKAQEEVNYPYLFLNPTQHSRTEQTLTYRFNLIMMDLCNDETYLKIQSQCQQYIDDVLAHLTYHYKDQVDLQLNIQLTPFKERFADVVAGMTATIEMELPAALSDCYTPFPPDVPPTPPCEPTLTIFNRSHNTFEYTKDPDSTRYFRWETNTEVDNSIGTFSDQWFSNAVDGTFEFYMTQQFRFLEPIDGESMPSRPVLDNLLSPNPIQPDCDSGNWPTEWPGDDPITYSAKYTIELTGNTSFGIVGFENEPGLESGVIQLVNGTLTIGYQA
jgi:hypothetical protein